MTHEEKIHYMQIACNLLGYNFDMKGLDAITSVYDLILEKKGATDLESISKIRAAVDKRDEERITAIDKKKLNEKEIR